MNPAWLILIVSLPTQNSAGRMRVWRALKALGCAVLRDGVYLLPYRMEFRIALQLQADDIIANDGSAHILSLDSDNAEQQQLFEALLDRSNDYAKLIQDIKQFSEQLFATIEPVKLQKQVSKIRKEFENIVTVDFFPGAAQEQTAMALEDLEHSVLEQLSPDEPHAIQRRITKLLIQDYQNKIWATRQRPWIDRLASAWLIHRFIDPHASFMWIASPDLCPKNALGFDFDGATFTHVGAKVTFEVLLESFKLNQDPALAKLGTLVHYLDVGGIAVPEAAGLETLIRGMQQRLPNDDELLSAVEKIFDAFYQAFQEVSHV